MKKQIANVLANRYASAELVDLWSAETKIILERQLWIAVLKAQRDLGVDVPAEAIAAYENVIDKVDLESIANREKITRHDVKARIEEFNALAGYEQVHKGMTSRDLTENVEQLQVYRSLELIRTKAITVALRIAERAAEYDTLVMAGRSHNVAAQATTLGKRFASAAYHSSTSLRLFIFTCIKDTITKAKNKITAFACASAMRFAVAVSKIFIAKS